MLSCYVKGKTKWKEEDRMDFMALYFDFFIISYLNQLKKSIGKVPRYLKCLATMSIKS